MTELCGGVYSQISTPRKSGTKMNEKKIDGDLNLSFCVAISSLYCLLCS